MKMQMIGFKASVLSAVAVLVLASSAFAAVDARDSRDTKDTDLRIQTQQGVTKSTVGSVSKQTAQRAAMDRLNNDLLKANPQDPAVKAAAGIVKTYESINSLPANEQSAVRGAMSALAASEKGGNFEQAIAAVSTRTGVSKEAIEDGCGK